LREPPTEPGEKRLIRGGSFGHGLVAMRSAYRHPTAAESRGIHRGVRAARELR
jgi:formylglycine-generating enzyme required for sulfatase activity